MPSQYLGSINWSEFSNEETEDKEKLLYDLFGTDWSSIRRADRYASPEVAML